MNTCSLKDVRSELARLGVQPSRRFGQNFLIDGNILKIILEAAEVSPADRVLEVGPGLGVLSVPVADACGSLVCVEKDYKLAGYLKQVFSGRPDVEVIGADIMRVDFSRLGVNKCVSNLPYSIGSRFLVDLVSFAGVDSVVVMVQEEVARKMCEKPGSRDSGLMGLLMQMDYDVCMVKNVKPGCFWPRPEVDSSVVKLVKRRETALSDAERIFLRKFAKQAFSQRRKQMGTLLRKRAGADRSAAESVAHFGPRRPEELSLTEWFHVARTLCGR